jgi:2-haloacid dehalogenase
MRIKAVVFDAYGTLFDTMSVSDAVAQVTEDAASFAALWRAKQIEYTWLRTLMGRYAPFWQVTEDALRYTALRHGVELTPDQHDSLMHAWLHVAPFPDTLTALRKLDQYSRAILSNGTPAMLHAALAAATLNDRFDTVLSVETTQMYKPRPEVYALIEQALHAAPHETAFVSSNAWDAAGAMAFGLRVVWINRAGLPMEQLGFDPEAMVQSLEQLPAILEEMNHRHP